MAYKFQIDIADEGGFMYTFIDSTSKMYMWSLPYATYAECVADIHNTKFYSRQYSSYHAYNVGDDFFLTINDVMRGHPIAFSPVNISAVANICNAARVYMFARNARIETTPEARHRRTKQDPTYPTKFLY